QLDLGHHQAGIVAAELVHLPQVAGVAHVVAMLLDPAADTQRQQLLRILHRDRVFEFLAAAPGLGRLDVEEGGRALDAHPYRGTLAAALDRAGIVEIALGHGLHPFGGRPPALAADQELALDLDAHACRLPPSRQAMLAECPGASAACKTGRSWTLRRPWCINPVPL